MKADFVSGSVCAICQMVKPLRRRFFLVQIGKVCARPWQYSVPITGSFIFMKTAFAAKKRHLPFAWVLFFMRHLFCESLERESSVFRSLGYPATFLVHEVIQSVSPFQKVGNCHLRHWVCSSGGALASGDGCPSLHGLGVTFLSPFACEVVLFWKIKEVRVVWCCCSVLHCSAVCCGVFMLVRAVLVRWRVCVLQIHNTQVGHVQGALMGVASLLRTTRRQSMEKVRNVGCLDREGWGAQGSGGFRSRSVGKQNLCCCNGWEVRSETKAHV